MGLLDDVLNEAKRGVTSLRQRSREAADHARLRLEKAGLQRDQEKLYRRLGHDLYILHRQGIAAPDSLHGMLAELDGLELEIHRKQEAIQSLLAGGGTQAPETPAAPPGGGEEG